MPSKMGPEARKILNRWARCEFYIYMRPTSSKFVQPKEKPGIYWVVSVEYRTMPPGQWRAEGRDLDEVIRRLDLEVPKSRPRNRINQNEQPGWCAPEKMKKRAVAEARKRRTQGGYASGGKKVSDLKPPPKGAGAGVNPKKRKKAKK